MKKFSALILLPCAFALLTGERVEAAPVTWDFIATGCSSDHQVGTYGCDPKQTYPVELATLTLTGPDGSGSAVWNGIGSPIYAGSDFSLDFAFRYRPITPAFPGYGQFQCNGATQLCSFNLSWSESVGQLDAVYLNVYGYNDTFLFGLAGGSVASDDTYYGVGGAFAGCVASECRISGYWLNDALLTAPEPGSSLALLASAFGVWGLTGRRTVRPKILHVTT